MPTPQEVLSGLANELSAAVADLVVAAQGQQSSTDSIAQALADMLEIARARREHPPPQVTVQVNPTPVNVQMPMCDCCVEHEYDGNGRLVRSYVKRTP